MNDVDYRIKVVNGKNSKTKSGKLLRERECGILEVYSNYVFTEPFSRGERLDLHHPTEGDTETEPTLSSQNEPLFLESVIKH